MSTKLPADWCGCPEHSSDLIGNIFFASKTPLNVRFENKLPEPDRYSPQDVFDIISKGQAKVGLWIDLTNTSRYYNRDEIERQHCSYFKLACLGHGKTPDKRLINKFISSVRSFLREYPTESVLVHCTHGFNRTGFLIVAYLVEVLGYRVDEAIKEFAFYRPPGIYRNEYVVELFRRYGPDLPLPPPIQQPPWCQTKKGRY